MRRQLPPLMSLVCRLRLQILMQAPCGEEAEFAATRGVFCLFTAHCTCSATYDSLLWPNTIDDTSLQITLLPAATCGVFCLFTASCLHSAHTDKHTHCLAHTHRHKHLYRRRCIHTPTYKHMDNVHLTCTYTIQVNAHTPMPYLHVRTIVHIIRRYALHHLKPKKGPNIWLLGRLK